MIVHRTPLSFFLSLTLNQVHHTIRGYYNVEPYLALILYEAHYTIQPDLNFLKAMCQISLDGKQKLLRSNKVIQIKTIILHIILIDMKARSCVHDRLTIGMKDPLC